MTTTPVLVTGATGNTGTALCAQLTQQGWPFRAGSRHPDSTAPNRVRFDWHDNRTWGPALTDVRRIYLVPPATDSDPAPVMVEFLQQAADSGAQRIILLGAAAIGPDDGGVGAVYSHLPRLFEEWAVLRPSWFMQNFTDNHQHADAIRRDGRIRTATESGRVAFIDAADIASVAFALLTGDVAPNRHLVLTGPKALSFDDVASTISKVSGRTVRHENVSVEVLRSEVFADMPPAFSAMLAGLDARIAAGEWDEVSDEVELTTGHPPVDFEAFAQSRRSRFD